MSFSLLLYVLILGVFILFVVGLGQSGFVIELSMIGNSYLNFLEVSLLVRYFMVLVCILIMGFIFLFIIWIVFMSIIGG